MSKSVRRLAAALTGRRVIASVLAGVAALSGSYAAAGFTRAFAFTPVSSFVVDETPPEIIGTVRATVPEIGQEISVLLALGLTVALFAVATAIGLELGRIVVGPALGTLAVIWLVAAALTGAPLLSLGAALPAAAVATLLVGLRPTGETLSVKESRRHPDDDRRRVLGATLGVVGFTGAAYIAGSARTPAAELATLEEDGPPDEANQLLAEAAEKSLDLPGSPDLVSEIGEFYTIDINSVTPRIDAEDWQLDVTGAVESELSIGYDDLREMETVHRFSTLRCVGENLNDHEMDNAVWTAVPASEVVEQAGATGDYAVVRADDGFWNTIPAEAFADSYLAYGMNGNVLPREHGHPVRLVVPGRWGEVNVKWLDAVEFTDEDVAGYWEERGWDGTGEVSAVAKLWTVEQGEDGVVVGGHAYDGVDGISAVELSLDGGESWLETELSEELSVGDAWRQWRHEFDPDPGEYDLVVRAIDGNGDVQEEERDDAFPDGATGWVGRTITVE